LTLCAWRAWPTASVLDLGAGTGKLTRLLVSEFDRVVAVEPAEAVRRLLIARCPGAEALSGPHSRSPHIPLDLGGPHASSGWRPAVAESPFGPFAATVLPNPQMLDPDGIVAFYASMGWLAEFPDEERLPLSEIRSRLTAPQYQRSSLPGRLRRLVELDKTV
jgi:SAM-dependent methyltransferase